MAGHLLIMCVYAWVSVVTSQTQSKYTCLCNVLQMLKSPGNNQPQLLDRLQLLAQQMYSFIRTGNSECKCDWIREKSSCYLFENVRTLTWEHAARYCQDKGGRLVRVDSLQEHNFIMAQLKKLHPNYDQSFWTAGNDLKTEGIWVWGASTDRFNVTYWDQGQPDDSNGEDCLEYRGSFYFKWNDLNCDNSLAYICEIEDPTMPVNGN